MSPKITVIIPVYNEETLLAKALASIPKGKDIEVLILDDGSTDNSFGVADKWRKDNTENFWAISVVKFTHNHGIAPTMNAGFSLAKGEYLVSLSSDDYYTTDFEGFRPYLDGQNDLVFFDLEVNDGSVWHLDEKSKKALVGAVKFIRRDFLGNTRIPNYKYKEDTPFSKELYAKNPKEVYTGIVLKHYNWPREGSLSWQATQDYEQDREKWAKNAGIIS